MSLVEKEIGLVVENQSANVLAFKHFLNVAFPFLVFGAGSSVFVVAGVEAAGVVTGGLMFVAVLSLPVELHEVPLATSHKEKNRINEKQK